MLEDYKRAFPQPSYTFVPREKHTLADVSKGAYCVTASRNDA